MKTNAVFYLCACAVILCAPGLQAADESVASSIAKDAKEVKKEFNKTVDESKKAVVRDVKALKEGVPKDLQDAKEDIIMKSKEVKKGATQELREIREGLNAAPAAPHPEKK